MLTASSRCNKHLKFGKKNKSFNIPPDPCIETSPHPKSSAIMTRKCFGSQKQPIKRSVRAKNFSHIFTIVLHFCKNNCHITFQLNFNPQNIKQEQSLISVVQCLFYFLWFSVFVNKFERGFSWKNQQNQKHMAALWA